MFHRDFIAVNRERQAAQLVADGLSPDEAARLIALVSDSAFVDAIVKARVKCSLTLPVEAYSATTDEAAWQPGQRLKQLKAWLDAHPVFDAALKAALGVIIAVLLSGS